ncbi:hypothetical protein FRB90_005377 [Tulasnella sp. 427]|nr:hypothetical protein FRB90_005377 [Tulasnella sp. 427]
MSDAQFSVGSLYLAGLAQAIAPHAGLIIPSSENKGYFAHIKVDPETRVWVRETRTENIRGNMALTTLVKLRDVSAGTITKEQLDKAISLVPAPEGGEFGECLPWVLKVVKILDAEGLLSVKDINDLGMEFGDFAKGNRKYATRAMFPNVITSAHCS